MNTLNFGLIRRLLLLVELVLHHQSSTVATSAAAFGGAGAATAAASSGDPLPVGAVSFVPAAVPAGLTSSSGTQLAVSAGSAVQSAADTVADPLDEVRIALRDCKESIKKCVAKIDGIETEISTFEIRLAALGVSDDAERDELKSGLAQLESKETLMRQLQLKLQEKKNILLRQQEALSAQSRESKEAAGSLSQCNSITPRSHDCCNRSNFKSLSFYCAECRRFVLKRILFECVSII